MKFILVGEATQDRVVSLERSVGGNLYVYVNGHGIVWFDNNDGSVNIDKAGLDRTGIKFGGFF